MSSPTQLNVIGTPSGKGRSSVSPALRQSQRSPSIPGSASKHKEGGNDNGGARKNLFLPLPPAWAGSISDTKHWKDRNSAFKDYAAETVGLLEEYERRESLRILCLDASNTLDSILDEAASRRKPKGKREECVKTAPPLKRKPLTDREESEQNSGLFSGASAKKLRKEDGNRCLQAAEAEILERELEDAQRRIQKLAWVDPSSLTDMEVQEALAPYQVAVAAGIIPMIEDDNEEKELQNNSLQLLHMKNKRELAHFASLVLDRPDLVEEIKTWPTQARAALLRGGCEYLRYFPLPAIAPPRPFLPPSIIAQLRDIDTGKLKEGDVLHVPFSKSEEIILRSFRETEVVGGDENCEICFTPDAIAKALCYLPGRTMADCLAFLEADAEVDIYEDRHVTINIGERIVYQGKDAWERQFTAKRASTALSDVIQHGRETGGRGYGRQAYRALRSLYRKFRTISAANFPNTLVIDVKLDPTGQHENLVVGCAKQSVEESVDCLMLIDLRTGSTRTLLGHLDTVAEIQYSCSAHRIISASYDHTIRVWNSESGICEGVLGTPTATPPAPSAASQSQAGSTSSQAPRAESASSSGSLSSSQRAAVDVGPEIGTCRVKLEHKAAIERMTAHPVVPSIIATCSKDKKVIVWDIDALEARTCFGETKGNTWVDLLSDIRFMGGANPHLLVGGMLGNKSGDILVWDLQSQTLVQVVKSHKKGVTCLGCNDLGTHLLSGSEDATVNMYDARSFRPVQTYATELRGGQETNVVMFSPCSRYVAIGGEDNIALVYDISLPDRPLYRLRHQNLSHITTQHIDAGTKQQVDSRVLLTCIFPLYFFYFLVQRKNDGALQNTTLLPYLILPLLRVSIHASGILQANFLQQEEMMGLFVYGTLRDTIPTCADWGDTDRP